MGIEKGGGGIRKTLSRRVRCKQGVVKMDAQNTFEQLKRSLQLESS